MVPITYVGAILLTYIFLVGPGDYFLLGLLKMRRYTWIVFPVVTVLFTGGLVLLSNHYMSTTETGGSIEICDVTGDKIAFVGSDSEAAAYAASGARSIDLGGKLVLPGLVDAHTHPGLVGISHDLLEMEIVREKEDLLAKTEAVSVFPKWHQHCLATLAPSRNHPRRSGGTLRTVETMPLAEQRSLLRHGVAGVHLGLLPELRCILLGPLGELRRRADAGHPGGR